MSMTALAVAAVAIIALTLLPANHTLATPTRENGNCGGCHPFRTTSFLAVDGLPAGTYTPNTEYTVTITLADANGATGENNFNFILSAAGGTLATTDSNVEINSVTQASANDGVSPMTVSTWTLKWTSPASGSVTINTWAVVSETGATGVDAPYDLNTVTLSSGAAIPEFPALIVPILGIGIAVVVIARMKKKPE